MVNGRLEEPAAGDGFISSMVEWPNTVTHTMQRASRSKIQHSIPEVDYICFNEHLLCLFTARPKFKGSLAETKFLLAAVYILETSSPLHYHDAGS